MDAKAKAYQMLYDDWEVTRKLYADTIRALFDDTFFNEHATRVAREAAEKLDAEMIAMYERTHSLYLLPPPALRPGCPVGNICAEETFHTSDGFPISIFVPEAGCPVHDAED